MAFSQCSPSWWKWVQSLKNEICLLIFSSIFTKGFKQNPWIRKWTWHFPLKWEAKLTNLNWPPLMDLNCGLVNQVGTCYTALHLLRFTKLGEAPGDYFWKFASSWNFCHFQVLEKNCERMRKLFVSDDLIGWKGLFESNWTYRVSQKNAT